MNVDVVIASLGKVPELAYVYIPHATVLLKI